MALIGRHTSACLACGMAAPHIKQNEGKLPYIHCPECGLMVQSKNGKQAAGLLAGLRPELHTAPAPAAPQLPRRADDINVSAAPAPAPAAPEPKAPAAKKKAAGWCTLMDMQT